jgi:hypothetical protein
MLSIDERKSENKEVAEIWEEVMSSMKTDAEGNCDYEDFNTNLMQTIQRKSVKVKSKRNK